MIALLPFGKYVGVTMREVFGTGPVGWIILVLLTVLSAFVAFGWTIRKADRARACPLCRLLMKSSSLPSISLAAGEALIKAMQSDDLAAATMELGKRHGKEICPTLSVCPVCRRGVLDAWLALRAYVNRLRRSNSPGTIEVECLVGSWELEPARAAQLEHDLRLPDR
jgi:hypothetical protein